MAGLGWAGLGWHLDRDGTGLQLTQTREEGEGDISVHPLSKYLMNTYGAQGLCGHSAREGQIGEWALEEVTSALLSRFPRKVRRWEVCVPGGGMGSRVNGWGAGPGRRRKQVGAARRVLESGSGAGPGVPAAGL